MDAAKRIASGLEEFVGGLADLFAKAAAEQLRSVVPRNGVKTNGHRVLDMRCRVPGCKERSRGPRFRYLCRKHTSLGKAKAMKLLEAYRAKAAS